MPLSLYYCLSPQIPIPPWQLLYWAALLPSIFAQYQAKHCKSASTNYTVCTFKEVLGIVHGQVNLACNFTFPQKNAEILNIGWIKKNLAGSYSIHKWKNGTVISTGTTKPPKQLDILGDVSAGRVSLKILNLRLSDNGHYMCEVQFKIMSNNKNDGFLMYPGTKLVVGVQPKLIFLKQSINGTIELTCKATGFPLPNLDLLDPNSTKLKGMMKNNSTEVQLQIKLPELAIDGKYTCLGRNIHGEARVEILSGLHDEPRFLIVALAIGTSFLVLVLVTALTALIYWKRRKTVGNGKDFRKKSSSFDISTKTSVSLTLTMVCSLFYFPLFSINLVLCDIMMFSDICFARW
uniref:Ig-like domain-containing protein n=2 Tax=Eptatretus burgeri TaxID=7764 RepID=A0A8C4R7E6_EPTBU